MANKLTLNDIYQSVSDSSKQAIQFALEREDAIDRIIQRRKELGMTQTDLAAKLGIKQATVAAFEAEGADPKLATIQRYAAALGMNLAQVFSPPVMILTSGNRAGGSESHNDQK